MAKRYRKIQHWDNTNKWVPINRLSNHELVKYLVAKKTTIEGKDGFVESVIPADVILEMAKLAVKRSLDPEKYGLSVPK